MTEHRGAMIEYSRINKTGSAARTGARDEELRHKDRQIPSAHMVEHCLDPSCVDKR
ncbi:hypothetical protein RN629_12630 [Sphingomonadaceae bacterium jetA1]|uniref:hypothetical protein n=1 Tax=Facivitalis istanbulensis TaxID=3075838 RepID=UPI0034781E62